MVKNPFEETMMAGMNVPQRTRPTMRDVAGPGTNYNEGYGPHDVTISNLPARPRAGDTPIQTGGRGFTRGEFSPQLYSGRNPFIQPIQTGGREGEFSGIFGGRHRRVGDAAGMVNDTLPPEYDISQTGNPSTDWKTLEAKILEIENNNPGIDPAETQRLLMEWLADQQKRVI